MSSKPAASRPALDAFDLRILSILQEDATAGLDVISERAGLSRSPCWRRIQRLELEGVIRGRIAVIDPASVGLALTALVFVAAPEHSESWKRRFAEIIAGTPEIIEAQRLAGDVDYLIHVVVADTAAFDRFYSRFSQSIELKSVTSRFVLETMKSRAPLPLDRNHI